MRILVQDKVGSALAPMGPYVIDIAVTFLGEHTALTDSVVDTSTLNVEPLSLSLAT